MAAFVSITLRERFLEFLFPARRRAREAKLREGIRWLMRHPEERVTYDGRLSDDHFKPPQSCPPPSVTSIAWSSSRVTLVDTHLAFLKNLFRKL
jgi:hypothetical protein